MMPVAAILSGVGLFSRHAYRSPFLTQTTVRIGVGGVVGVRVGVGIAPKWRSQPTSKKLNAKTQAKPFARRKDAKEKPIRLCAFISRDPLPLGDGAIFVTPDRAVPLMPDLRR